MRCKSDAGIPEMPGGVIGVILHGVLDVALVCIVIAINSVVIVAIWRYRRKLKGAGASVRLVFSLAIIDIFSQLSIIYFLSFEYSCAIFTTLGASQIACLARLVPFIATSTASMCNMVALALDRYVAVVHSLRYQEIMNSRLTNILILISWMCGFSTASALAFWNNWTPGAPCEAYQIVPFYFVTVLSLVVLFSIFFTIIYLHWRVHRAAVAARERCKTISTSSNSSTLKINNLNTKSARFIYIVLGCFVCLVSPLMICVILRLEGFNSPKLDVAYMSSLTLYNLMFFVNIFIYAWKNFTVKVAIMELFGLTKRKNVDVNFNSTSVVVSVLSDCTLPREDISVNKLVMDTCNIIEPKLTFETEINACGPN